MLVNQPYTRSIAVINHNVLLQHYATTPVPSKVVTLRLLDWANFPEQNLT